LASVLAASCLAQTVLLVRDQMLARQGASARNLPIFVPVSLEYERAMRRQRNQPVGRGGEQALELVRVLLAEPLEPATAAQLEPSIRALRDSRARLLELRNRRHALNVAMMDLGVALVAELEPGQWEVINAQRDVLRASGDLAAFDQLLESLR